MSIKVKVQDPYQVSYKGTCYKPGDVVEVPDELGRQWFAQGWVKAEAEKRGRSRNK